VGEPMMSWARLGGPLATPRWPRRPATPSNFTPLDSGLPLPPFAQDRPSQARRLLITSSTFISTRCW
jgi:hypothetical protein